MKQYIVKDVDNPKKAEVLMNQMAQYGWEVKSTCYWQTSLSYKIVITFEK